MKVFPLLISFGILLFFCISENNFVTLVKIFPKLNFFYFICSVFSMVFYWLCDSAVLSRIFQGTYNSFYDYIKLTMRSQFYNSITPFNSGGQPSQVMRLSKTGMSAGKAISKLAQKFFVYQLCCVAISLFFIMLKSDSFKGKMIGFSFLITVGVIMQCAGLLSIILFYLNKERVMKIVFWASRFLQKIRLIKNAEKINSKIENQLTFLIENDFSINCGISIFVYSFLQNIFLYSVPFFIAKAFGLSGFPVLDMLAAQVFITLISSVSPLPGAAGTAEGGFLLILGDFFVHSDIAPAMILCRLVNYYLSMILGFILTFKDFKSI
ncbi:MAG: flippase-like domain-containing protein [Oscillospiraceae bacterium]|jgi:uncharacterized protein (TIRG00374 family)|nr:flippase-like domain-containing protein [Oscillospiraceae bacterium]